jgi:hypothetical protein
MRRDMRKAFLCGVSAPVALAAFAVFGVACGSNKANINASASLNSDAGAGDGGGDAMAMMDDGGMDAGMADAAPEGGNPYGAFLPDGGMAPPTIPPEGLDVAIDTAVNAQAGKIAPKMTLEGQPLRATLAPGGRANMVVTMAPGKCYTFVAFSPPGNVTKLELKLMTPPFYNVEAAKSGAGDKNMPVIGKGTASQCPVSPIAVPYRLDAIANEGGGRVGVYVFSRSK